MLAIFKAWVVLALLFYNSSAFANQCITLFSHQKPSVMKLADSFEAIPTLELYSKSETIQIPEAEFNLLAKRIDFYKNRVKTQLSDKDIADWFKPIQEDYIVFISNKLSNLETQVQVISKNSRVTLYDYTAIIIRSAYIGQSIEAIVFTINNIANRQAMFDATRALTSYESLAFETIQVEMIKLDKMIKRRIDEVLKEQQSVYQESGFRLRPILTLFTPSIKTINRLSARGYSVITVPKTYTKADGTYLSVINYLNHDLFHLSLKAGFYRKAVPTLLNRFRNFETFAAKKRKKYLKKNRKFNQKFFKLSESSTPLESYLLEAVYFYITHERGIPSEKLYFRSFFNINSSISVANEIYKAIRAKEWGYDPIVESSHNLKMDLLLSIAKFKKIL